MHTRFTPKDLCLIGLFTALTAIMAQIAIPIPFSPLPISFGLVAVYMTGMLLPPRHALLVQLCYLLLGAMGIPVFGQFRGGIAALLGPAGGYLLAYPAMAFITAVALNSDRMLERENSQGKGWLYTKTALALCVSHALLYTSGTLWFAFSTQTALRAALPVTVFPFIPLDSLKIIFCVLSVLPIRARLSGVR